MSDYIQIAIDDFDAKTYRNLGLFLIDVNDFFKNNYNDVFDWYSGRTANPNIASFETLFKLTFQSEEIMGLLRDNKNFLTQTFNMWELTLQLEEINTKLHTTLNLSKLLRSTRTKNSFQNKIEMDYTTKKYDTFESIQRTQVSSSNFDNAWWDLALLNDLSEGDYDTTGGEEIKIPLPFQPSQYISSVVDNPIGERMYGKDVNRKLLFLDDDLETLNYNDTVIQSIEVSLETTIGSVPEMPTLGYDAGLMIGNSSSALKFPVFQRQLLNIFNTDDTFSKFSIKKLEFTNDSISVEFEIQTVRGEVVSKTINLN